MDNPHGYAQEMFAQTATGGTSDQNGQYQKIQKNTYERIFILT